MKLRLEFKNIRFYGIFTSDLMDSNFTMIRHESSDAIGDSTTIDDYESDFLMVEGIILDTGDINSYYEITISYQKIGNDPRLYCSGSVFKNQKFYQDFNNEIVDFINGNLFTVKDGDNDLFSIKGEVLSEMGHHHHHKK